MNMILHWRIHNLTYFYILKNVFSLGYHTTSHNIFITFKKNDALRCACVIVSVDHQYEVVQVLNVAIIMLHLIELCSQFNYFYGHISFMNTSSHKRNSKK